jgi:HEAT repeat protein
MGRMSRIQCFPTRRFQSLAARLALPLILALASPGLDRAQQPPPAVALLQQFESARYFWQQLEVAKAIVATKDASILPKLELWLTRSDRCMRSNAAFVFASLGDPRGFDVITAILNDRSDRPIVPGGFPYEGPHTHEGLLKAQIRADRTCAVGALANLKDPRAVPILVPLLRDADINWTVTSSLGQIGDQSAIDPLIVTLSDKDPSMRVLAIHALVRLKATEALPKLRQLLGDKERCKFGKSESVAEAAQSAIPTLESAQ